MNERNILDLIFCPYFLLNILYVTRKITARCLQNKTVIYQTIRDRFRYHINNNACHQSFMKQFLFEMKLNTSCK